MVISSSRSVVVAVFYDPERGFFLHFNEKWQGYALPMTKLQPTDEDAPSAARRALRDAVNHPLRNVLARPLEYLVQEGRSGRTGHDALYHYQVFEVDPNEPLPDDEFGGMCGFLSYERLMTAEMVTGSTKAILRELMENQQVVMAVISRQGPTEYEFLMVRSLSYNGYFFPSARFKTETRSPWETVEAVRRDTGYLGRIKPGKVVVVKDVHFSPRYGRERQFAFHVVSVSLPGVQLEVSPNAMEEQLERIDTGWQWVPESALADPAANDLSPTVSVLRQAVLQVAG
jgi:hypothetical protein